jgi:hypothetical protein
MHISPFRLPLLVVLSLFLPLTALATTNDDANKFVRQQYRDFLNREPDQSGLDFWTKEIISCGNDQQCIEAKEINVSAAFFLSIEFQNTGYLVERFYKAAYGDPSDHPAIRLLDFLSDAQSIGQGVVVGQPGWQNVLESNKTAFAESFTHSLRFTSVFPLTMTPAEFVDKLRANVASPVLDRFGPLLFSVPNTWKSVDVAAPNVFRDAVNNRYVMDYSGYDGKVWCTGLAYSQSPRGPWIDEPRNPVFCPANGEGYIAASGAIVYDQRVGLYYYVYQGGLREINGNPLPGRIYAASSPDLINWTRLNNGLPILSLGATIDSDGQHDPDLRLRSDGLFEVFFAGYGNRLFRLGHAVSSDLIHWSPTVEIPIGYGVGNVAVSGIDPTHYSIYFIRDLSGESRYVCQAVTDDGVTFRDLGGVFYKGPMDQWDSAQVFDPAPLVIDQLYLFYSGGTLRGNVENLNAGIGLASPSDPMSQTERDQLVNDLLTDAKTRAQVLRAVAEDSDLARVEFNRAFVLMQYFGYLRRNPNDPPDSDYSGYAYWLAKLNQFGGNYQDADMVKAFISSTEYRQRLLGQ